MGQMYGILPYNTFMGDSGMSMIFAQTMFLYAVCNLTPLSGLVSTLFTAPKMAKKKCNWQVVPTPISLVSMCTRVCMIALKLFLVSSNNSGHAHGMSKKVRQDASSQRI